MTEITIDGVRYRVIVDHDMCMGNRVCETRAAGAFAVDDATNLSSPVDGELDPGLAGALREAVADCPQDAIRLEPIA